MAREGILILGCGYTGAVLASKLGFEGRPVFGTTRSEARTSVIRSRGAEAILMEADDLSPIDRLEGRIHAVVTMIPPTMERGGGWTDPTARILEHVAGWGLDAFVYVSSTSVYGDRGGDVVTEDTPCTPDSPRGEARLAVERQVLSSGLPARVVRPAGIYGPGRSQLHRIAEGRYKLIGEGDAYTNRIHVGDLAAILEGAIDRGEDGAVYLGSDEEPATQREVVEWAVESFGLPEPPRMSMDEARVRLSKDVLAMITGSKRIDGGRTRERLGVRLRYPDFRAGLSDIWRREGPEIRKLARG
ncbi:MAG: SDR family oxidoreductase [Myxococcota bacterium]